MKNSARVWFAVPCIIAAVSSGKVGGTVKHRWASFGVGSWSLQKTLPLEGGGGEVLTRFTLKALTPTTATVEIEIDRGGQVTSKDVPWPIPEGESHPERTSQETVDFKGRSLRCQVLDYPREQAKIWECEEVPGFIVKLKGPRSITTLVDYEAKR
jgi:hypothetical protein